MSKEFVVDSFALLAMFKAEAGGVRVRELLQSADRGEAKLAVTSVNLGEVFYRTVREFDLERAQAVLASMQQIPVEVIAVDYELAIAAAHIKGFHRLSYADCIAAALAQRLGAVIITGDPEFKQLEGSVSIEWLPA